MTAPSAPCISHSIDAWKTALLSATPVSAARFTALTVSRVVPSPAGRVTAVISTASPSGTSPSRRAGLTTARRARRSDAENAAEVDHGWRRFAISGCTVSGAAELLRSSRSSADNDGTNPRLPQRGRRVTERERWTDECLNRSIPARTPSARAEPHRPNARATCRRRSPSAASSSDRRPSGSNRSPEAGLARRRRPTA